MNKVVAKMTGALIPLAVLLLWEVAVRKAWLPPSLSASPSAIVKKCTDLLLHENLAQHLKVSLLRIVAGVSIGTILGILSGLILGQLRWADRLFSPFIGLLAPVPVVVWMPFVIMAVGSDETYKVILAVIASFLIIHINTFRGVQSISNQYLELAEMYQKNIWEKIWHIFLPGAASSILTGLRLTLAIAWIVIFFVEYSSSQAGTEGLGWFINDARQMGRVEDEYAGVLLLAIVGYATDLMVVLLQNKMLRWSTAIDISIQDRSLL